MREQRDERGAGGEPERVADTFLHGAGDANPVVAAWFFDAALPNARPTQTITDQDIFPTRSAASAFTPGTVLKNE